MTNQMPGYESPYSAPFFNRVVPTISSETANAINVKLECYDGFKKIGSKAGFLAYLSNDANGNAIIANAPSGGVAIGTDGVLIPLVTNKAFHLVTEDDGDVDITITDVDDENMYLCVLLPTGKVQVTSVIDFNVTTTTSTTTTTTA